jgi:hypothetical protein
MGPLVDAAGFFFERSADACFIKSFDLGFAAGQFRRFSLLLLLLLLLQFFLLLLQLLLLPLHQHYHVLEWCLSFSVRTTLLTNICAWFIWFCRDSCATWPSLSSTSLCF